MIEDAVYIRSTKRYNGFRERMKPFITELLGVLRWSKEIED